MPLTAAKDHRGNVRNRDTVERSRNYCCNAKTTMRSINTVYLHVPVNNIKILSVAQQSFYAKFMMPATIERTWALA
jgi:hypothetical protein